MAVVTIIAFEAKCYSALRPKKTSKIFKNLKKDAGAEVFLCNLSINGRTQEKIHIYNFSFMYQWGVDRENNEKT